MSVLALATPAEAFGRYVLYPPIARGGMATVHLARLVGAEGFSRLVAAKRLHAQFTDDPDFVTMFHDEARIASRIHHPNVVPVLDVVLEEQQVILVLEYVHGVPLSQLMRVARETDTHVPIEVVLSVVTGALAGLHAAHEAKDDNGVSLQIVHRDVSPQNVMVSVDGMPRLLDFGIAKARSNSYHTREGLFKGKLGYMAPEQIRMAPITRTADVYAMGVLLWELLVNRRFHSAESDAEFVAAVLEGTMPTVTMALLDGTADRTGDEWKVLARLEPIVAKAISVPTENRYQSAEEMLRAIIEVMPAATPMDVARWVRSSGAEYLDRQEKALAACKEDSLRNIPVSPPSVISGIQSGIQRVSPAVEGRKDTLVLTPTPTSISFVSAPEPHRLRHVAWLVVGALAIGGAVGGVAQSLGRTPEVKVAANPREPEAVPPQSVATQVQPVIREPVQVPAAPPAMTFAPVRVTQPVQQKRSYSPPAHAPAQPTTQQADKNSEPSASAAAKSADCATPYYFEGSKKIFKAKCL